MSHDKLAFRMAKILEKFSDGEAFSINELACEFNVSNRTIMRDLHERLAFLPINLKNGKYSLSPQALGILSYKDLRNFALLSGLSSLYPSLDKRFLSDLVNEKINPTFLVQENGTKPPDRILFESIAVAILRREILQFSYKEKSRNIKPYKLINECSIWYLLGDENGTMKNFALDKILHLQNTNTNFKHDEKILENIKNRHSKWRGESKSATLWISNKAERYFTRRKILPYYELIDKDKYGFSIRTNYSFDDEILQIVRYWIPYIKIIEPTFLADRLKQDLQNYLKSI